MLLCICFFYYIEQLFNMFFISTLNKFFIINNKRDYLLILLVHISIKYQWEIISRFQNLMFVVIMGK